MPKDAKKLVVLDALAYAYRSFYAIRELTHSSGKPLNAVYGFVLALQKAVKDFQPDYAVVAFDAPGPTFRDKLLKQYKAQRQPMPESLAGQLGEIQELIPLLGWNLLARPGFEADDIMATLAQAGRKEKLETILLSSDKDLLQMVGPGVRVYRENPMGGSLYGPDQVKERYGVGPALITDLLGLMGDSSDNIPGVPGVGEKTAAQLLQQHGSLEGVLKAAPKLGKPKLSESLTSHADQARASRELAVLKQDVPVPALEKLKLHEPDYAQLLPRLKALEFKKLFVEFSQRAEKSGGAQPIVEETPVVKTAAWPKVTVQEAQGTKGLSDALKKKLFNPKKPLGIVAWPEKSPHTLALAQEGKALVLRLAEGDAAWGGPLEDFSRLSLFRAKPLHLALMKEGREADFNLLDVELGSYLLNPSRPWRDLGEASTSLSLDWQDLPALHDDLAGPDAASLAAHAQALSLLAPSLEAKLKAEGLTPLYADLENPLIKVLARMERTGVRLDLKVLDDLEAQAQKTMATLKDKAFKAAGTEFNLNSPQQLADVLFTRLNLPVQRRNKTGPSTDTEVLEALAGMHELPGILLEHRGLAKLSSTYLQGLSRLVEADGRLRSSWNQAVAATGRLSSSDPNLQNIPIRTELGRQVRKAFVPGQKGDLILTADYSQIELRVLAHYTRDEALVEAFRTGEDIHARTASKVFHKPLRQVDGNMRRQAKVINFGILYGMSPFGLSRELGIPQSEARDFIDAYFAQFPKVSAFLESCKRQAREEGFVGTLMGRRRPIPEIHSANRNLREFAERTAINTPIQGSAADLIKKAMLEVDAMLAKRKARTRIILQVHDELVFDLAKEEAGWLPAEVQKLMEGTMKLEVPLKVGLGQGKNWYEAGHE
jgi:DNA polymerase-1